MAASTPYRRTGCSVISVTRSGRRHEVSIGTPSRTFRYSGSDRPAWRMNHTGVRDVGSPRQARTRSDPAGDEAADKGPDGALTACGFTGEILARGAVDGPPAQRSVPGTAR